MADEWEFHIDAYMSDLMAAGKSRDAAERLAHIAFGDAARWKEQGREARGLRVLDEIAGDVRYACRMLRVSSSFSIAAVLTLALGTGVAMLMFSIVYAVFLRPLPIPTPERVVALGRVVGANVGVASANSFPDYREFQRRNTTFDDLAAFFQVSVALDTNETVTRETPFVVTGNYFELLGVRPWLGRLLTPADDRDGATPAIVLSYDFWTAAYRSDPTVLGRTVRIVWPRALSASAGLSGDKAYTVVGVAPKGFYGTDVSIRPPAWVPLHTFLPEGRPATRRAPGPAFTVFGRLKKGVSRAAAHNNLATIANDLVRESPMTSGSYQVAVVDFTSRLNTPAIRAFASAALALAGLVLLAGCVSVATRFAARTIDRSREIGIRMALGAGRFRVIRLALVEALLISGLSATIALVSVWWTTQVLSHLAIPGFYLPVQVDVRPDGVAFVVATVLSILASGFAVITPARTIAKLDPNWTLKGNPASVSARRRWGARDLLTVAQVVFSCVLVAAALVSLVGIHRALTMPLGFDAGRVAAVTLDFDAGGYNPEQQRAFMTRAAEEVGRLPGVESVAYTSDLLLSGNYTFRFAFPERQATGRAATLVALFSVTEDYRKTLGIRLLAGRDLDARDTSSALVNEAFVRHVLQSAPPIGSHVTFGNADGSVGPGKRISLEIAGVVADGKYTSLAEVSQPAIFMRLSDTSLGRPTMVVRAYGSGTAIAPEIRRLTATLDPRLPALNAEGLEQLMAPALLPHRAAAITLTAFGVVALVLAIVGVHSLVNYTVSRRRPEIGVRLTLGASRPKIIWLVVSRICFLAGSGIAIGVVVTVTLARLFSHIVYLASSTEPIVVSGVTAVMCVAIASALVGPTIRALRIEPMLMLRSE